MTSKELTDILIMIAHKAYMEGRQHQLDDDFPDVGLPIEHTFEDTEIYRMIKEGVICQEK